MELNTLDEPDAPDNLIAFALTKAEVSMLAIVIDCGIDWAQSHALGNFAKNLYDKLLELGLDRKGNYHFVPLFKEEIAIIDGWAEMAAYRKARYEVRRAKR